MKNPRFIRADLIKPNMAELEGYGELMAVASNTGKPGPKPKAYYLNEEQALLVCMWSKTKNAALVRKQVIATFVAYRRGQLVVAQQTAPAIPTTFVEALRLAADEAAKWLFVREPAPGRQPKKRSLAGNQGGAEGRRRTTSVELGCIGRKYGNLELHLPYGERRPSDYHAHKDKGIKGMERLN